MANIRFKQKLKWTPSLADRRCKALNNPYCGFYTLYKFYAHSEIVPELDYIIEKTVLRQNQSLCLVEINLIAYRTGPLTNEALNHIRRIFNFFTSNNKEMIVRFLYDWDGNGIENEPAYMGIILDHMKQLSPLLKAFTDSIYILQGLFIGSWGEMHSSRYLTEQSLTRLANQLYQCSGDHTYIAVRSPSIWRTIFKTKLPFMNEKDINNCMQGRFCLYNDGILASETDCGTYGTITAAISAKYSDKYSRYDELKFQDRLCTYVPNGGEIVSSFGKNDFKTVCKTFSMMHVSFLNGDYDPEVIRQWKESKASAKSSGWRNKSAYEYIAAHLGYRFFVKHVAISYDSDIENRLLVEIYVRNTGFSCCYSNFPVSLVIRADSIPNEYVYDIDTDTRSWLPGLQVILRTKLDISKWDCRELSLGLRITDQRRGKPIIISNSLPHTDDNSGFNSLGCLKIVKG